MVRHRAIEDKYAPVLASRGNTEQAFTTLLDRSALVVALRGLPTRQREAVVLRFYADLSPADAAKVMGISRITVNNHATRGVAALREALAQLRAQ